MIATVPNLQLKKRGTREGGPPRSQSLSVEGLGGGSRRSGSQVTFLATSLSGHWPATCVKDSECPMHHARVRQHHPCKNLLLFLLYFISGLSFISVCTYTVMHKTWHRGYRIRASVFQDSFFWG